REAIAAARAKELSVVALLRRGSALAAGLGETDVAIAVPHERTARVHEVHLLVVHCLCDALDLLLMGEQDPA
ncbi:MAG: phosphoheptose isomerase, partial [Rubrivivax sp.]|nr:phosphoheptose isomerase [Rubrivivax sp.]